MACSTARRSIPTDNSDVVADQGQVDDLLDSLGF